MKCWIYNIHNYDVRIYEIFPITHELTKFYKTSFGVGYMYVHILYKSANIRYLLAEHSDTRLLSNEFDRFDQFEKYFQRNIRLWLACM